MPMKDRMAFPCPPSYVPNWPLYPTPLPNIQYDFMGISQASVGGTNTLTNTYQTNPSRWTALLHRDSSASSSFVYSVRTTRIYCRPNCAARLARRANVSFFDNAALAEEAGFRACKRCKPDLLLEQDYNPLKRKVEHAVEIIRQAAAEGKRVTLPNLAKEVGLSKWHLRKVFKKVEGMTPSEMSQAMAVDAASSSSDDIAAVSSARVQTDMSIVPDVEYPQIIMQVDEQWEELLEMTNIQDVDIEELIRDLFPGIPLMSREATGAI